VIFVRCHQLPGPAPRSRQATDRTSRPYAYQVLCDRCHRATRRRPWEHIANALEDARRRGWRIAQDTATCPGCPPAERDATPLADRMLDRLFEPLPPYDWVAQR